MTKKVGVTCKHPTKIFTDQVTTKVIEIEDFATYVNGFHPSLNFTWVISDVQVPFLDLCLKPTSDRLLTSKKTDTHSYLNYMSSHPARCKNSILYSPFLHLRRICSEENDFQIKSKEMASFFRTHGYPSNMVQQVQERVSAIAHDATISERSGVPDAQPIIHLVLTYHPTNALVKNIMTRNFHLLRDDPDTGDIYRPLRVLCAYRRDTNLRDSLVRSHLNDTTASVEDRGTFPCGQSQCNTCAHTGQCFTYDQHSWGTYHYQFQVHLYKLQRGMPYQMLYLQQGLCRRNRKTPGRSIQRTLTFNTTNQH